MIPHEAKTMQDKDYWGKSNVYFFCNKYRNKPDI